MDEMLRTMRKQGSIIELLEGRLQALEQERHPLTCERQPSAARDDPTTPSFRRPPPRTSPPKQPAGEAAAATSPSAAPPSTASAPPRGSHTGSQVNHVDSHRTLASSVNVNREPDPFKSMWAQSRFDEERQMFEKSLLRSIHDRADQSCRNRGARWGLGIIGLLSIPFGPIGILGGGLFGALVGGFCGTLFDRRKRRTQAQDLQVNQRKLRSLIRWASDTSHKDEDLLQLIEMVTLEFKLIADLAADSANARKLLRLLDRWISQARVTRQLWIYMDTVLQDWRSMSGADFVRSMHVFQTLRTMYRSVHRVFSDQELQFLHRMERLLEHRAVKSVMTHSNLYSNQTEQRIAELMVYADRERTRSASRRLSRGATTSEKDGLVTRPVSPSAEAPEMIAVDTDLELGPEGSDQDERAELSEFRSADGRSAQGSASGGGRRLRKPFFKNWDDFMEFDIDVKHRMPISLSEFELLLQKESESCKGWDVPIDRKDIKVAKVQSGPGVITLRAWASVPGVLSHVAFHLFYVTEERMKWDKVFAKQAIIGADCQGSDILYSLLKPPVGTPRDFLQYRRIRLQKDGSILIVLRSAEHPDCPEESSAIRAESYISGYVLRQEWDGEKPVLKIFLMSCSDIKGLIPKWIVNTIAPRKPGEWIESLRKAAVDFQQANPGVMGELQQTVQRFAEDVPFDFEGEGTDCASVQSGCVDDRAEAQPEEDNGACSFQQRGAEQPGVARGTSQVLQI